MPSPAALRRALLVPVLAFVALLLLGMVALVLPMGTPGWWLAAVVIVAALAHQGWRVWRDPGRRWNRGWWNVPGLRPAYVVTQRDGSFEFHPANEPQPTVFHRLGSVPVGVPPEPPSHVARVLSFELRGADEPAVRKAFGKATHRATGALPGTGKLHARAHVEGGRLVVRLSIEGPGAGPAWADAAEAAFRREMAKRIGA